MDTSDPFGTAALRAGVLAAWRDSPTRLREDAATEADLVRAGYRDRLLTELAQNAADAAVRAGVPGRLVVELRGDALHVMNTGVPLDVSGVHALTALRASAKSGRDSVGEFGVGFTAVLSAGDEVEFRSTTGSLRFSRARTWEALREAGVRLPEHGPRGGGDFAPPALRLVWPEQAAPAAGFDSEVVVRLRADVDAGALLAAMRSEAIDLLLELPALRSIRVDEDEFHSVVVELGGGLEELRIGRGPERAAAEAPAAAEADDDTGAEPDPLDALLAGLDAETSGSGVVDPFAADDESGDRVWWQFRTGHARWLLPVRNGRPVAARPDVLRAPTRSDEELSLPALLIADIAMQPDRRRLLPGGRVARLASGYADFARALPPRDRLLLVPAPGFARSEVDGLLREALIEELRTGAWLPVLTVDDSDVEDGGEPVVVEGVAAPTRSSVFTGASAELAQLLADLLGPLVIPELSGRAVADRLAVLDVHRIGLARIAELSAGLERPLQWWYSLYDALQSFVGDPLAVEELGALAVPLADGRQVTGPRTVVVDDQLQVPIPVHWARLVHPEADHDLLIRLGARRATVEELLTDPALRAELEEQPDDPDTVDAVLQLAGLAGEDVALPEWLGMLELPDDTGELLPAEDLLLPGAPLAELLVDDSPFGTVDVELVEQYGAAALRAVGVGWGFAVVTEADPTGPDHDLDEEDLWWDSLPEDPPVLAAVRDLDLIDADAWPDALRLLLSEPETRRLLGDRDGYTVWWLRRYARIDDIPLGIHRAPSDTAYTGLLPELSGFGETDVLALRAVLADPGTVSQYSAAVLLEALADPTRNPSPEVISRVHGQLAEALPRLFLEALTLPGWVRALSGDVLEPSRALVLDQPWYAAAVPADRLVVGELATAPALAALLDLPLVSQVVTAEVLSTGRRTTWADEPLGVLLRLQWGGPAPEGELVVHERLRVRLSGAYEAEVEVPWWRIGTTTHVQDFRHSARSGG
ncbi:sacsin N-terminal ATP-binding-like domain-containing protein [Nocardia sp. alder85J]|uniref:sacsin N-terminal ATP-binding-like domain-containing protein n=1 Tax=Nocardia sp. alder85J TaxID=2862949 RepID=UPI001CD323E7|nr:ATP-binding protein [Nocardia sp. alder85J]MCX4093314.1 ATP-binding protein [Nocardia sp. alder85J]